MIIGFSRKGRSWQTVVTRSVSGNNSGWSGFNLRLVIAAAQLASVTGSQIRATLLAGSIGGFTIDHAEIGHVAASGDPYDFDPALHTPLTFSGGSAGCTVATGGTILSDAVSLAFDHTRNLMLAAHFSATSALSVGSNTGSTAYNKSAASEVSTADVTGYSLGGNNSLLLTKVEVS